MVRIGITEPKTVDSAYLIVQILYSLYKTKYAIFFFFKNTKIYQTASDLY